MTSRREGCICTLPFLCNLSRYQRQVVLRRDRKSDSGLRCMEAMLRTRTRTTKTETDKHTLIIFDSVHSSIPRRARWAWVATSCSASNNFRAFNAWAPSAKEHGTTFASPNEHMPMIVPQHKFNLHWIRYHSILMWYVHKYIYRCIYIIHMQKYHEQDAHRGLINQKGSSISFSILAIRLWYITRISDIRWICGPWPADCLFLRRSLDRSTAAKTPPRWRFHRTKCDTSMYQSHKSHFHRNILFIFAYEFMQPFG